MHRLQLTDLCDRLTTRLVDTKLTRYQLLDMATALMFVQRDLNRGIGVYDGTAIDALSTSLHWIRDRARDASVDELRSHVATASYAAARMFAGDAGQPHPPYRQRVVQERVHA